MNSMIALRACLLLWAAIHAVRLAKLSGKGFDMVGLPVATVAFVVSMGWLS